MKDKALPLIKTGYKKQFTKALIKNGLSPEYYFKKVNLPSHDQDNPESLLPKKPFWDLVKLVALEAGIPDFGAQVAELTPWHKIDSLKPLIINSSTLEELLQTVCKVAPSQSTQLKFAIKYGESETWFVRIQTIEIKNNAQLELYRITGMIQLAQLAAGSSWRPARVKLFMPVNDASKHCRLIRNSHIDFSQDISGFSLPNILLKLPVKLEIPVTTHPPDQFDIDADFVSVIRHLIGIFINNKDCTIGEIARATEIPIRTLQRRLKTHKTCFNDLLNEAKFVQAKTKLQDSSLKISDIAFQLGYSDPAHFTHAFQRWAGMSPSHFRSGNRYQAGKSGDMSQMVTP